MTYTEKRFKLFGRAYIFRIRKYKSRPFEQVTGTCFGGLHWGRVSLLWGHNKGKRKLSSTFAG